MREIFTKNVFTPGYTGDKGTKVTPGSEKNTYEVEYHNQNTGEGSGFLDGASAILVLCVAVSLGICCVIFGFQYLSAFGWVMLIGLSAGIVFLFCQKHLAGDFKTDCILFLCLAMILILVHTYVDGMLAEFPHGSQERAGSGLFFVGFGGAFLTLGSTLGLGSYGIPCTWVWFVSLAWTTLASFGQVITMNSSRAKGWAFFVVIVYAAKLAWEYYQAKERLERR